MTTSRQLDSFDISMLDSLNPWVGKKGAAECLGTQRTLLENMSNELHLATFSKNLT
jgi:glycerate kinase